MPAIHVPGQTYDVLSRWYGGQSDPLYSIMSKLCAPALGYREWDESGTHFILDLTEEEVEALRLLTGRLRNGWAARPHGHGGDLLDGDMREDCAECRTEIEDESWAEDFDELQSEEPAPCDEDDRRFDPTRDWRNR